MEVVLTCKECGHEELGQSERLLMAKVRMWNHLNRVHPAMTDAFKHAVSEETAERQHERA
jgi:hypothetical protein